MSDLDKLLADLDQVDSRALDGMVTATTIATKAAQAQARQNASGRRTLPHYPGTITSEVEVSGGTLSGRGGEVVGRVGPEKRGQGHLGHLIEHGSPTSAPHMDVHQAVDGEIEPLARRLAAIAGRLL